MDANNHRRTCRLRINSFENVYVFTGRLVIGMLVVGGFFVVRRFGPFVGRALELGDRVVVVVGVVGAAVAVTVAVIVGNRCGRFVGSVVYGRCVLTVTTDDGRFGNVLFSTMSAKSWKLSLSDSTILLTSSPILSLSRSSSMNCGVEMS